MKLDALDNAFEIKIAFVGHKSSGKTTLINALLQDKYSQVGFGVSTVNVNSFRIFTKKNPLPASKTNGTFAGTNSDKDATLSVDSNAKDGADDLESVWSIIPENLRTAKETLKIISENNRSRSSIEPIRVATFDVELADGLCEMRNDTNLVLIDIPGINSSDTQCKYMNYLSRNWDSFDCVVFVIDVYQSIEAQVLFLKAVKTDLAESDVSLIIVCNKVDDSHNQELAAILSELQAVSQNKVIPLSAEQASVYRAASGLNFERFQLLDNCLIDKIGYNEFGRSKWMALSTEEKHRLAFETVSDSSKLEKCLASTNFPNFLEALDQHIGGDKKQKSLIEKQLNVSLKHSNDHNESTVTEIRKIISISESLKIAEISFKTHFWNAYKKYIEKAIEVYKSEMNFQKFYLAMTQLIEFDAVLSESGACDVDHQTVMSEMILLVRVQINEVLTHASAWSRDGVYSYNRSDPGLSPTNLFYNNMNNCWERFTNVNYHSGYGNNSYACQHNNNNNNSKENPPYDSALHWNYLGLELWQNRYTKETKKSVNNPVSGKSVWYDHSLVDFKTAMVSILLMSYHEAFCLSFGPEKIRMDLFLRQFDAIWFSSSSCFKCTCMLNALAGTYNDGGEFVPDKKDLYDVFVHFHKPDQISNPDHWGHLAWLFCKFMDSKRP